MLVSLQPTQGASGFLHVGGKSITTGQNHKMTTRGEKVCQFIERYCLIPEGSKVGNRVGYWTSNFFFGTSTTIQQRSPALGIMIVSTIAALIDPARMAEADAVLMMMYGSLSALVGAYFGFSGVAAKK